MISTNKERHSLYNKLLSHINNILLFLLLALFPARGNTTYASHRVATLFPLSQSEEVALTTWNANGELTSIVQPFQDRFRRHLWNEAGQPSAAISNEYCGYCRYNAQGERTYKLTGTVGSERLSEVVSTFTRCSFGIRPKIYRLSLV